MSNKAVIITILVVGILIGGAAATVVILNNKADTVSVTAENSEITYNYEVKDPVDFFSFYTPYSYYEVKAPVGSTYAVIKIIEKNNNFSKTYYPLLNDFKFKCSDGKEYAVDSTTSAQYSSTATAIWSVNLTKGQTYQYTVLSQIPADTSVTEVIWNSSSNTAYNDTGLKIDSSVGNQEKGAPSLSYNFKYDTTTTKISTHAADAGKTYVVYLLTIKNNTVEHGFKPSCYTDVKLKCTDGSKYGGEIESKAYPDTVTACDTTYPIGNSVTFHVVFEIPIALATGTTLEWTASYSGQLDTTLPVVAA